MTARLHALPTPWQGSAEPASVVVQDNARFTILTPQLVRLEWADDGQFEDRPSLRFPYRNLPVPAYSVMEDDGALVIETEALELRYEGQGTFTSENLSIRLKSLETPFTWRPGMVDEGNLGGTVRTLDSVSGPTELQPGLVSRDGWVWVDDSEALLFGRDGWPEPRQPGARQDGYFFGYGHNYQEAVRDFTRVSGAPPLPPRWSFGAWWSRYWAYSEQELKDLVAEFREHDVPLDVLVIDMDWHLDGWTGYTWNPEYFPDPEDFLAWVHDQGLHVTLNLHPHDGVGAHEAAFEDMARSLGQDPAETERIPFQIADRAYMEAYFKHLHHPLERQGVDFWWMDWQQGETSDLPGLDPLFWLNHLHWMDMVTNPERRDLRPMTFSRWAGLGGQRYQIGFSGDTYSNWDSLGFQPEFTAAAANVAYPYWSHDIGGHFLGPVPGEVYARWIQFAALNPFLRTHATKNPNAERRIWAFEPEVFHAARKAFHLRYALLPYIYTAAWRAHDAIEPMVKPLYYQWPEMAEAYEYKDEYLFGDQMLVAPVAEPVGGASRCAARTLWLPPGRWQLWHTGQTFEGPAVATVMVALDEVPLFLRGGAIVPMMPKRSRTGDPAPEDLDIRVAPGLAGEFTLYEDDGVSTAYLRGESLKTRITSRRTGDRTTARVEPAEGRTFDEFPRRRTFRFHFTDVWKPERVLLDGAATQAWEYDAEALTLVVTAADRDALGAATEVTVVHPRRDESPLRQGLRGRKALVRDLAERTGIAPPDIGEGNAPAVLAAAQDLAEAAGEDDALRSEILLRMLGIAEEFQSTASDTGTVEASLTVNVLTPIEGLTARVTFDPPAGWSFTGGATEHEPSPLSHGRPFHATVTLAPEGGAPQPVILGATLFLTGPGGIAMSLPMEQVLLPSINAWKVIGPFANAWEDGLDQVLGPETDGYDSEAEYTGMDGDPVGWVGASRTIEPGIDLQSEHVVDLHEALGGFHEYAVAYGYTIIHSPKAMDAVLALGSDDGVAAWLNGELVHKNAVGRAYTAKEDTVPVRLNAGENTLMLKITQGQAGWAFGAHLETPDGRPIAGLRAVEPE
ncbi:MAG: glycoside hydrolase family 31 protein [Sumerlaeia bacterium]